MSSKYEILLDYEYALRLIVVGDYNTGKTTFLNTYIRQEKPNTVYEPTIGIDFSSRNIELQEGTVVKLACWDTSGQENFKSIVRSYYRDICGAFLVFDVTNRRSFSHLDGWLTDIRRFSSCKTHTHPVLLLGTKIDVRGRQVLKEEAIKFADDNNLLYAEINALSEENLDIIVSQFVHRILQISNSSNCNGIKPRKRPASMGQLEIATDEGERKSPEDKTCCYIS
jgi:small GTP-binding protein